MGYLAKHNFITPHQLRALCLYLNVGMWSSCGGDIQKGDFDIPPAKTIQKHSPKENQTPHQTPQESKHNKDTHTTNTKSDKHPTPNDLVSMIGKGVVIGKKHKGSSIGNHQHHKFGNFGSCIIGKPAKESPLHVSDYSPNGQNVRFTYKRIENTSHLKKSLTASGKADAGYKDMIGKATTEYLKNHSLLQENRYYFYLIEVKNPEMKLSDVRLSPGAYDLYQKKGKEAFFQHCGKKALIGHKTGGYLLNIIQISKKAKNSQTSIDHLISASGFGFGMDGMLTMNDESDLSELDVSIFTRWLGGKGGQTFSTLKELREMNSKWPAMVAKNGVIIENIYLSYHSLLESINDPYYTIIQEERAAYLKELARLAKMKHILLNTPSTTNLSHIAKIEDFMAILSQQLRICNKTIDIEHCQNAALILQTKAFHIRSKRAHASCGVKSTHIHYLRHPSCGIESFQRKETKRDPRCGVEHYQKGKIFHRSVHSNTPQNQVSLKRFFASSCFTDNTERRMQEQNSQNIQEPKIPCNPKSDACLFEKPRWKKRYHYEISCYRTAPRFGVASYKACEVMVTKHRYKLCEVGTGKVKEYHSCMVDIEI